MGNLPEWVRTWYTDSLVLFSSFSPVVHECAPSSWLSSAGNGFVFLSLIAALHSIAKLGV